MSKQAAKPWADVIPSEDLQTFQRGFDPAERPISAGVKPALVIVDMTRAFVDSAYRTGHSETGMPALQANVRLLAAARERRIPVFFTKAYADPSYAARPAEDGKWKTGSSVPDPAGLPPGDVLAPGLEPRDTEIVIYKGGKPSGFFGTPLASYLIDAGADTVIVTGMTTSGCVRATVLDAFQYNFNVIIPFECAADRSQISHKVSLFDLHMKYADVVSLDETLEYLDATNPVASGV